MHWEFHLTQPSPSRGREYQEGHALRIFTPSQSSPLKGEGVSGGACIGDFHPTQPSPLKGEGVSRGHSLGIDTHPQTFSLKEGVNISLIRRF